jgi:hypothetical protein
LNPRANAYLLNQIVKQEDIAVLKTQSFCSRFEAFSEALSRRLREDSRGRPGDAHTHLLTLDPCFQDFLRLSADISRINREGALHLKGIVDEAIRRFKEKEGLP